jgi:outer membrane protein
MKLRLQSAVKLVGLGLALVWATGASAQSAGQWTAKLGVNKITPKVDSGNVSAPALPGTKSDVGADTQPILGFTYSMSDNVSFEFDLGTPYKHKLYGAGAIQGTGQLGTVNALPAILFAQYRFFEPTSMIRPFVGLGLTYAMFQKETGSFGMTALTNPGAGVPTTFSIDNKWTYSGQVGAALNIDEKWFASAAFIKTRLRTDVHFSTGQYQHVKLDPNSVMVSVGYKF